jgi:hypothetical protein
MKRALATFALLLAATWGPPAPAQQPNPLPQQTCPISSIQTNAAKSNTLFLYFPANGNGGTFAYRPPVTDFDAGALDTALTGQTQALIDRIHAVVADDYCEFNVQVQTVTDDPDHSKSLLPLPNYHATVAIGADDTGGTYWGIGPGAANPGYARVWAGYYKKCEGGSFVNGVLGPPCPPTKELSGNNATVENWAQAIGGTAAHEAGHTYGLLHTDEDPPNGPDEPGPQPTPGEDPYNRHLMPAGEYILAKDRVEQRRHFGDRTYGILATQIGLAVQTMHNWDLQNVNKAAGHQLTIDFLSTEASVNLDWSYQGAESPWKDPVVQKLPSTPTFQGTTYNAYRITWSTANPAYTGTAGVIPGGGRFHIGTAFTGVDFNQPNAIVVGQVTLYDAHGHPLALHPRLPGYDTGTVDSNGNFALGFFTPPLSTPLQMVSATVYRLPRVASIESMIDSGSPSTFDGLPIDQSDFTSCPTGALTDGLHCVLGNTNDGPKVLVRHRLGETGVIDCSDRVELRRHLFEHFLNWKLPLLRLPAPEGPKDSSGPDIEGAVCAGNLHGPFPSTTVYVIASFVDPGARHYDPRRRRYVTGPVISKLFYQFAGVRYLEALGQREPAAERRPDLEQRLDRDERHDRDERRDRHE